MFFSVGGILPQKKCPTFSRMFWGQGGFLVQVFVLKKIPIWRVQNGDIFNIENDPLIFWQKFIEMINDETVFDCPTIFNFWSLFFGFFE